MMMVQLVLMANLYASLFAINILIVLDPCPFQTSLFYTIFFVVLFLLDCQQFAMRFDF